MFDPGLLATYGWVSFEVPASELNTDYCAQAKSRLIEQFKNKENIEKYLCALTNSVQELEFVFGDLLVLRRLANATGTQLDGLGDIVGIERQGLNDEQYRTAIRFQVGVNFSNGEWETLIDLTRFITGGTDVHIRPNYPAGVEITTDGSAVDSATVPIIEESALAGVKVTLNTTYGSLQPFAVAPDPGDTDPTPQGFSEPNYAPDAGKGGELAEKFS